MTPRPPNSYPPVTPASQMEFTAPNLPPHDIKDHFGSESTDETRPWVARVMNSETFLCKIGDFLKDYGPVEVPEEDIRKCKEHLVEAGFLQLSEGKYVFSEYTKPPSEMVGKEDKVFKHVGPIINAIFDYAGSVSKRGNTFKLKLVPPKQPTASTAGTNHKMDACIIEDKDYVGVLPNNNIVIGKEFKKEKTWKDQITVREQIVDVAHHILDDDPRRMFVYGITIEDRRMAAYYFSRSHSIKSISFDWVSDDVERFIEIYLAFAFATPAELGIDPLVHKAPMGPKSKDPRERVQQYIYECRPQVDDAIATAGTSRYYKTMDSLFQEPPYRISGRMTRIWQVIEVNNIAEAKKIPGAMPVVLKDVWLDITRKTEAENMDLIFDAVDKFVADAQERYPGPQGLSRFMAEEPRFEHFDQATRTRLEQLLTGKQYRSLFLTKRHAWKGQCSKKLSDKVIRPLEPIFLSLMTATQGAGRVGEPARTIFSHNSSSLQGKVSVEETLTKELASTDLPDRAFPQKQQCRFIYEEVCARLWDLPTLGDIMDVLRQTLDALQVLWCAGWVHRDISNGNVLAFPMVDGKVKVKLSDLEFAQPHEHPTRRSDPRIGTPYFMPNEILARTYLFQRLRDPEAVDDNFADQLNLPDGEGNPNYQRFMYFHRFYGKTFTTLPANATIHIPAPEAVVAYNYQHDLESLWWNALYYITVGVGHIPSCGYAAKIFTGELRCDENRTAAFIFDIESRLLEELCPSLQAAFPRPMNKLREDLHMHYVARALFGQLNVAESYSHIHGKFAKVFDDLLSANAGDWKQIRIVPRTPKDKPRKRALEDTSTLQSNPEFNKRAKVGK